MSDAVIRRWFPWNGSKRWMAPSLADLFRQVRMQPRRFVDPFCGASTPARVWRHLHPSTPLQLSDANPWLVAMYERQLTGGGVPLHTDIEGARAVMDTALPSMTADERAWRFLLCLYSAWGNRWQQNEMGQCTAPLFKSKRATPAVVRPLAEGSMALRFMQRGDKAQALDASAALAAVQPGDLLFIDPPYPETIAYGNQRWSAGRHMLLLLQLADLPVGVGVIITGREDYAEPLRRLGFTGQQLLTAPRNGRTSRGRREVLSWRLP